MVFFKEMTFEFEDDTAVPTGSYFVGKVKSFIFFYNPANDESITYSTSKLKCIKYAPNSLELSSKIKESNAKQADSEPDLLTE